MRYEVEVKVLLGTRENVESLLASMRRIDPHTHLLAAEIQKNHYFTGGGDVERLVALIAGHTDDAAAEARFREVITHAGNRSLRTRETISDGQTTTLLVVKSSIDDGTSTHGIRRIEAEIPYSGERMTLGALDSLV